MARHKWTILLLTLLMGVSGVQAQEPGEEAEEEIALTGRVVDAETGRPLLGAFVHPHGKRWGVFSEENGRFRLTKVSPGRFHVAVEQLGYRDLDRWLEVRRGEEDVVLALTPDPIVLEGIEVVMDRFERRRRAFPHASQVVDREELMISPGSNLSEIIRRESFLQLTRCPLSYFQEFCAVIRGRVRPVRVYVDEMPAMGGSDYLDFLKPWELHLVEIYYSVGQVRVYTERFMERVGRRPMAVQPIGW